MKQQGGRKTGKRWVLLGQVPPPPSWHGMAGPWGAGRVLPGMEPSQDRAPWMVPLQADSVLAARSCLGAVQCKLVALSLFLSAKKIIIAPLEVVNNS